MIEQIYNATTSNGMREMTYERFKQAIEEYRDSIIKEIDGMITLKEDWGQFIQSKALTELKQKILEME